MDTEEIKPVSYLNAAVKVPGSKSLTQRSLVIAALARGISVLRHGLVSEDTRYLVEGLHALGAEISVSPDETVVTGTGGRIRNPGRTIFLGNNGTALRFLTTLVSLGKGKFVLDGDRRLRERPVGPLLDALKTLGVTAGGRNDTGYPPIVIEAGGISGGSVTLTDVESSQFVSSLLMVGPYAKENMEIQLKGRTVSEPYIDMTLKVMEHFGVRAIREGQNKFSVRSGQEYSGKPYLIEGDASSASYFFLAAALCRGSIRVENISVDSLQGDMGFLDIMEASGCSVVRGDSWVEVVGGSLRMGEWVLDMGRMPDMVPTLAVLSAFRPGNTVITHVPHLRFKESDRITALVSELNRIGVRAKETDDGLIIEGGKPYGAEIETYNDHRIAMSFAVAGLVIPGMRIRNRYCVEKSFPGFWDELKKL
jgi:3-phosphoshikimate 1-carboxyvinyltransferase